MKMKSYLLLAIMSLFLLHCEKKTNLANISDPQVCLIRVNLNNKIPEHLYVEIRSFIGGGEFLEDGKGLQIVTDKNLFNDSSYVESIFILPISVSREVFFKKKRKELEWFLQELNIKGYTIESEWK